MTNANRHPGLDPGSSATRTMDRAPGPAMTSANRHPGLDPGSSATRVMARGPGLAISWLLARVLGLLILLGLAAAAQAQDAPGCAADPSVDRMLAALPRCQKDATFLATLGQRLNAQGRYLEAADHLERALMLDANLKDAQLSYA